MAQEYPPQEPIPHPDNQTELFDEISSAVNRDRPLDEYDPDYVALVTAPNKNLLPAATAVRDAVLAENALFLPGTGHDEEDRFHTRLVAEQNRSSVGVFQSFKRWALATTIARATKLHEGDKGWRKLMVESTNVVINRLRSIKETVSGDTQPFLAEWRNRLMAWPNIMMGDPEKRLLGAAGVYGVRVRTENVQIGTFSTLREDIMTEGASPEGRARLQAAATLAEAERFREKAATVLQAAQEFTAAYPQFQVVFEPGTQDPARWVLSSTGKFEQNDRALTEFVRYCDLKGENPLSVATVNRAGTGPHEIYDSFYAPDGLRVNVYDAEGVVAVQLVRKGQLISAAELYRLFLRNEGVAADKHQTTLRQITAAAMERVAWLPMNDQRNRVLMQKLIAESAFAGLRNSFLTVRMLPYEEADHPGERVQALGTIRTVTINARTGDYISHHAHGQNDAGPVFDEYIPGHGRRGIMDEFVAIHENLYGIPPGAPAPATRVLRHLDVTGTAQQIVRVTAENPTRTITTPPLFVETDASLAAAKGALDQTTRRLITRKASRIRPDFSAAELKAIQRYSRLVVNPRLSVELAVLQTLAEVDAEIAVAEKPITPCHHDLVSHAAALRLAVLPQVIGHQQEQEQVMLNLLNGADTLTTARQLQEYVESIIVETHTMRRDFERADRPLLVHTVLREVFAPRGTVNETAYRNTQSREWKIAKLLIYQRYNNLPPKGRWEQQAIMDGRVKMLSYRIGDKHIAHVTERQLDQTVAICMGGDHGTYTMANSRGERESSIAKAGRAVYPEAAALYTDTNAMFSDVGSKGEGLLELMNTGADGPYRIVTAINRTTDEQGRDQAQLNISIRRDVAVRLLNSRGIAQPSEQQIREACSEIRLRVERAYRDVTLLFATYAQLFDGNGKPRDTGDIRETLQQARETALAYSRPYTEQQIGRFREPTLRQAQREDARRQLTIFTSRWWGKRGKK